MDSKKYVTVPEIAKILNLPESLVYGWAYNQHIQRYKVVGSTKNHYELDEVLKYYESGPTKKRLEREKNYAIAQEPIPFEQEHKKPTLQDVKLCIEEAFNCIKLMEGTK